MARWVHHYGWIEVRADGFRLSGVRVLDEGELICEELVHGRSLDETLAAAERAIATFMHEQVRPE